MKVTILASLKDEDKIKKVVSFAENTLKADTVIFPTKQPNRELILIDYDYISHINTSDFIIAIPKEDTSFGESVSYEIATALYLRKTVLIWRW